MEFRLFLHIIAVFGIFTLAIIPLSAQNLTIDTDASINKDGASASIFISTEKDGNLSEKTSPKVLQPYPIAYRNIKLGMSLADTKKALLNDSLYGYRGDRDVSMLPTQDRVLIETAGLSFLNRSWFQFYEDKLYTMIFKLDEDRVDFYSIFKSLSEKYGEPTSLDPEKIVWKNESVTLSLERPLVIKYIDTKVFQIIQDNANIQKSREELTRQGFLESL